MHIAMRLYYHPLKNWISPKKLINHVQFERSEELIIDPTSNYKTDAPYEILTGLEIFVQKKHAINAMIEVIKIIHPNLVNSTETTDFNIKDELTRPHLNLINDHLQLLGYLRNFGTIEKKKIENSFRMNILSRIINSNSIGFKNGSFLLKNLANDQAYESLFYIPSNEMPWLKTHYDLCGFGALLDDRNLLPLSKKEEIFEEIKRYFISSSDTIRHEINLTQANEELDAILAETYIPLIADNRRYKAE